MARARRLGAAPSAPARTEEALRVMAAAGGRVEVLAAAGEMGEREARDSGFRVLVVGSPPKDRTGPEDTRRAAREMAAAKVDLLLFAGGDGTARDICDAVGSSLVVVGVPAGVKMHSGVYAISPRHAGRVAADFLHRTKMSSVEAEVMDIDEASFRRGVVSAKLYGYLRVPEERRSMQAVKSGGGGGDGEAVRGIAAQVLQGMEDGTLYIFGPGTTTRDILAEGAMKKTLLGVDVVLDRRLVARDVSGGQLTKLITGRKAKIVVTPIGGQGYIFGRGNQQLSPEILERVGRENIVLVATKSKLSALNGRPLLVDTGSESLDRKLSGFWRVTTGYREEVVYRAEA